MAEQKSLAKQIREKFFKYQSARSKWDITAKEDEEFKNGNQWTKEAIAELTARRQSPIVVNVLSPTVEQGVALLTTNKPRFTSTGRDDSDTKTGRIFADLLSYVWDISDGNRELKTAIEDYYVRGLGYLMSYSDPYSDFGKGDVKVCALDSFDVYVDPTSKKRDFSDADSIIVSQILTKYELERRYPDFKSWDKAKREMDIENNPNSIRYDLMEINNATDDLDTAKYRLIDCYTKTKKKVHRVFDPILVSDRIFNDEQYIAFLKEPAFIAKTQTETRAITDVREIREMQALYDRTGGTFHMAPDGQLAPGVGDPITTTQLIPTIMDQLLKAGYLKYFYVWADRVKRIVTIGDVLYYEGTLDIENYPIVPLVNNHNRTPYPFSDVRKSRGLQEYINKTRSLIIAHASSSTNVKLLIPRGSTDRALLEEQWGRSGTAVIEFDAEIGQPIVAGPIALPNELYKNEADAKRDIELIFGIWSLMHGESASAPDSFKGTVALDEMGQRRIKSKKDDIESSINQLAKVCVELIQQTYTDEKVIRLLRPNNAPKEVTVNQGLYDDITGVLVGKVNDITIGKYDVIVVSGSMLPSNRWGILQHYLDLYAAGIIDQVEVLKKTEVADIEGVLERSGHLQQLQAALQDTSDKLSDLEGDFQTLTRENQSLMQRAELEKFKAKLAEAGASVQHATTLYNERLNDDLAKRKEFQKNSQQSKKQ